jgi:hypothetical protein
MAVQRQMKFCQKEAKKKMFGDIKKSLAEAHDAAIDALPAGLLDISKPKTVMCESLERRKLRKVFEFYAIRELRNNHQIGLHATNRNFLYISTIQFITCYGSLLRQTTIDDVLAYYIVWIDFGLESDCEAIRVLLDLILRRSDANLFTVYAMPDRKEWINNLPSINNAIFRELLGISIQVNR